jgi:hypothetical protein
VLAALPKSAHPGAKKALAEIWNAEDKDHAQAAVKAFEAAYGAKFPKAVAKITDDLGQLLAFFGSLGLTCCATVRAAACAPRSWPSSTARWGSGPRCTRFSPTRVVAVGAARVRGDQEPPGPGGSRHKAAPGPLTPG